MKYLWGLVNSSQLMALVPLVDVAVPPNVMLIFRFLTVANGALQIMNYLPNVFREKRIFNLAVLDQQQALNPNYEFVGYESGSFFLLQELKIVLLIFYLAFLVPCIIIYFLLSLNPRWYVYSHCLALIARSGSIVSSMLTSGFVWFWNSFSSYSSLC